MACYWASSSERHEYLTGEAMSNAVRYIERKLLGDAYFLYNAFAPMQANTRDKEQQKVEADHILVKVGISTVPMNRIHAVHQNCPFRVAYAAFTPLYAFKQKAEAIEAEILEDHREYRTRGEWLMIPNTAELKQQFSSRVRIIVERSICRPVEWRRVTGNEIATYKMPGKKAA